MSSQVEQDAVQAANQARIRAAIAAFQSLPPFFRFLAICLFSAGLTCLAGGYIGAFLFFAASILSLPFRISFAGRLASALSAAVYLGYFSITRIVERTIDSDAHLLYIEYSFMRLELPQGSDCIVCHHPPLYHLIAGYWYYLFGSTQILSPDRAVQAFALVCMLLFSLAGAATLDRFVRRPWLVFLGTLLLSLWPYSIIMSARVHNDVLSAATMAWTVYACVRWFERPSKRWFYWGLSLAALSIATKMSGLLVYLLLLGTIGLRTILAPKSAGKELAGAPTRRDLLGWTLPGLAISVVLLGLYLELRDRSSCNASVQGQCRRIDANHGVEFAVLGSAANASQAQQLQSEASDYLYLDPIDLVRDPFSIAKIGGDKRDLFWNTFLKSSLFSTYNHFVDGETYNSINRRIASSMMVLLMSMLACLLADRVLQSRRDIPRTFVLLAAVSLLLAAALAFRVLEPTSHHSDLRHVFAILAPAVVLYLLFVERALEAHPLVGRLGVALASCFIILSVLYFVPKTRWTVVELEDETVVRELKDFLCEKQKASQSKAKIRLAWNERLRLRLPEKGEWKLSGLSMHPASSYTIDIVGSQGSIQLEQDNKTKKVPEISLALAPDVKIGRITHLQINPLDVGFEYALLCVEASELR